MNEVDLKIRKLLEELKKTPDRDRHAAARGRARFISEIASLQPVSSSGKQRQTGWNKLSRKEQFSMNMLIALIVTAAAILGGIGVVYAAQDDLPNEPLYGAKILTEEARLFFSTNPQTDVDLLIEMIQARVQEIIDLSALDQEVPVKVIYRLENQITQALQAATSMDDAAMLGELERIRAQVQLQTQQMTVLQNQSHGGTQQALEHVRIMLEIRLQFISDGMADPQGFQNTFQNETTNRNGQTQATGLNGPESSETLMPQGGEVGPTHGTPQGNMHNTNQGGINPSITPTCAPIGAGPFGTPGGQGGQRNPAGPGGSNP